MYKFYNPNPLHRIVEDCVIRAIAAVTDQTWDDVYIGVVMAGYDVKDMPSSSRAWGSYLENIGFEKKLIHKLCPECYTIIDFCYENSEGNYLLVTDSHVVAVKNGDYYDTWDSGEEVPIYYWQRRK